MAHLTLKVAVPPPKPELKRPVVVVRRKVEPEFDRQTTPSEPVLMPASFWIEFHFWEVFVAPIQKQHFEKPSDEAKERSFEKQEPFFAPEE